MAMYHDNDDLRMAMTLVDRVVWRNLGMICAAVCNQLCNMCSQYFTAAVFTMCVHNILLVGL